MLFQLSSAKMYTEERKAEPPPKPIRKPDPSLRELQRQVRKILVCVREQ